MTEAEWHTCRESSKMVEFIRLKTSDRKLRLFACACCRRIWDLLVDARSQAAVEFAELYADGGVNRVTLLEARDEARQAKQLRSHSDPVGLATSAAFDATRDTGRSAAENCLAEASRAVSEVDTNHCDETELQKQADLLRDIVGNPFHPVALDPLLLAWDSGLIPKLAHGVYDDRAFDRLPIIADALEEAGCTDADILSHLRSGGAHVRGCWVIDPLTGRS